MHLALFSFVFAVLSVQVAISRPFERRDATIDGMYNIIVYIFQHILLTDFLFFIFKKLDVDVLNYALTLEHLENAFYTGGLEKYNDQAFQDAGYPSWVRKRYLEIAAHEAAHVAILNSTLGANATQPCTYSLYVIFLLDMF